jgi:type II secretory pathway pseudopilin PulG
MRCKPDSTLGINSNADCDELAFVCIRSPYELLLYRNRAKWVISGFTLIEMLVVIVSMVAVLAAATGFLITAVARQKTVLDASQLEAHHAQLADSISNAIKTADDFQIFEDSSTANKSSRRQHYGRGVPYGNYLSCRRASGSSTGWIEQDYEFVADGMITQTTKFLTTNTPDIIKNYGSARVSEVTCFSMKDGILQAHWQVSTMMDRVDFNVYGMPLNLR